MDVSHLLDGLNEDQRQAVGSPLGAALVLGGAGRCRSRAPRRTAFWRSPLPTRPQRKCAAASKRCWVCRAVPCGSAPFTALLTGCCPSLCAKVGWPKIFKFWV